MQNPITVTPAPDKPIPEGLHNANVTRATMQQRANRNGKIFTALHLEFTDENGARATMMIPDFTGMIPSTFRDLGEQMQAFEPVSGERLLGLRGKSVEVQVVHKPSNGKIYANALSIRGQK
jgi:hypothetical protein